MEHVHMRYLARAFSPVAIVLVLAPLILVRCEPSEHRGYQEGTISFAVPINLCETDRTWQLEFALPKGDWYFASIFVFCPDEPIPESDSEIRLRYTLDLADGNDESGGVTLDLRRGHVESRMKHQFDASNQEAIAAWRDSDEIWPWHAMVSENPRYVFPTPLGIGIAREQRSIGRLSIAVENPDRVPEHFCEAQLRIDTYLGH